MIERRDLALAPQIIDIVVSDRGARDEDQHGRAEEAILQSVPELMGGQLLGRLALGEEDGAEVQPAPSCPAQLKVEAPVPAPGAVTDGQQSRRGQQAAEREGQAPGEGQEVKGLSCHILIPHHIHIHRFALCSACGGYADIVKVRCGWLNISANSL